MSRAWTRRQFLKRNIAAATAAAVGIPLAQGLAEGVEALEGKWTWDRGVCRFCGVGCGILLATHDKKIKAVKGDPDNPVNRGLLCVKGYHNAEILYGEDRLTKSADAHEGRALPQAAVSFVEVSWERAFDEMEQQFKRAHGELGPTGVAIMGSGQYTIQEGLRGGQARQGRLAHQQHRPQRPALHGLGGGGFMQVFGIDEPSGNATTTSS